jgi:hypothetical protein
MIDACCALCRTPSGVCASKYACEHHRVYEAQDEADSRARRTYNNPTQDRAIRNVMASRNPKRPRR